MCIVILCYAAMYCFQLTLHLLQNLTMALAPKPNNGFQFDISCALEVINADTKAACVHLPVSARRAPVPARACSPVSVMPSVIVLPAHRAGVRLLGDCLLLSFGDLLHLLCIHRDLSLLRHFRRCFPSSNCCLSFCCSLLFCRPQMNVVSEASQVGFCVECTAQDAGPECIMMPLHLHRHGHGIERCFADAWLASGLCAKRHTFEVC